MSVHLRLRGAPSPYVTPSASAPVTSLRGGHVTLSDPPDPRFDICTRPWIPVRADDRISVVSLRELLLRSHDFTALALPLPPAAAGLMRMLYALAARIAGLDTCDDAKAWNKKRYALLSRPVGFPAEAVDSYLDSHRSRLFLFDPRRPFLQDPRLTEQSPSRSGVNKLVMARPSGNNPVFLGHFTDDAPVPLPPEEALHHLIAQLYYGPSGQCTPRTVDGKRYGNVMGGPLRRTISFHPQGRTLYESLLLGIPKPAHWPQAESGAGTDGCPWEREELLDPLAPPRPAAGPLSMLTERHQHAILLTPDEQGTAVTDATITWALREKRPDTGKEPYLIWDETKDGTVRPRDASAERALWRDLDALILLHRTEPPGRRPPVIDGLTGGLPAAVRRALHITAYGFDQDGQTRDRSYFSATTPPVLHKLLSPPPADPVDPANGDSGPVNDVTALANEVKDARVAAEKAASRLRYALHLAWRAYTSPFTADRAGGGRAPEKGEGPWPGEALAHYWPAAEQHFWGALHTDAFLHPQQEFGRLALDAYDEVTRAVAATPRGAKAREEARGLVRSLLKPPPPPSA
ncbi:type I-E CRISPR-associated protein Cse1/CasA [Streptomyces sp. Tu 6176]|uniref:type I-E CRISPR-associated protein Cse1/CasA n=1 Tax=Streptomyces sp. Tu 6176 TaxID=1470557 RepID=UPI00227726BA|nr:type I-E CRISPR-associated protein Cse1/CasA [Streptomyces sp. Tu 6176]